ncbi:MAG: hypothetical protein LBP85_06140, partial [Prevotellaceae bacterium]|nr:hypothetical protein [Prevotellaceae bacterium]
MVNRLILGDNLETLKSMDGETVDLIYLDPPFFSNSDYEVIWGDEGEVRSFQDRWAGGIEHYIAWLKERVVEMHRVLKPTGSIFLHCDWHADAYIRVEILDKIFGRNNFINEIVWCYAGPANVKNRLAQKHDMIYFYSKTDRYFFDGDSIRLPYNEETVARTSRGASNTGIMAGVKGDISERHKSRLNEKGKFPEDYWVDIPRLQGNASERIGYPTQKPFALLERIVKCASNEGDLVLDPFMGGGTANIKQRNDFGLDGKMPDNTPIQVKRSENVGRSVVDNFFAAVQRSDKKLFDKNIAAAKPAGYIIAFSFGRGAVEEVARLKLKEHIIIELVRIDTIIPVSKKPNITFEINELSRSAGGVREIEFIATGHSDAGIEF